MSLLSFHETHKAFMLHAISLAKKGMGFTSPNPMVGAVIVKNGIIIGEGYHIRCGRLHAEREALASCSDDPTGATMYVTLEPCCHFGRTPPCTDAIISAKISHVVVGSLDPNPLVAGKGIAILRDAGINVTLADDETKASCEQLNQIFFHYVTQKTPYVACKFAMTADGKIATRTGASRWISGEASRAHAHELRQKYSAILVGIGTVLADDPLLNCRLSDNRLPESRNPLRLICDSRLRIPLDSQICQSAKAIPTIVACTLSDGDKNEKAEALASLGVRVWHLPSQNGQVDMSAFMHRLHAEGIDSVLAEGGSEIHFSLLSQNLVQKVYSYISPQIFGGKTAPTPVGGLGVAEVAEGFQLKRESIRILGEDVLLEYNIITKGGNA